MVVVTAPTAAKASAAFGCFKDLRLFVIGVG